jgi:hypothetical protein
MIILVRSSHFQISSTSQTPSSEDLLSLQFSKAHGLIAAPPGKPLSWNFSPEGGVWANSVLGTQLKHIQTQVGLEVQLKPLAQLDAATNIWFPFNTLKPLKLMMNLTIIDRQVLRAGW